VLLAVPPGALFPRAIPEEPAAGAKQCHIYRFSGSFCPACRLQDAHWANTNADEVLAKQGIISYKLDIAENVKLKDAWRVKVIPTTIIVEVTSDGKSGTALRRFDGCLSTHQIRDFVDLKHPWKNK